MPPRRSTGFVLSLAVLGPVFANAVALAFAPRDDVRTMWLSNWAVACFVILLAAVLATRARNRAMGVVAALLTLAVGALSWLAVAALMIAP